MALYLSQDMIGQVNEGLRKLHDILEDFDKAEKCGIDCVEYRAFHAALHEQLAAMKQQFDPPKAPT